MSGVEHVALHKTVPTLSSTAWTATAYDGDEFPGYTAANHRVRLGIIAVDPHYIPLGTCVLVNGKPYLADDTGSAIKGHIVDIFMLHYKQAVDWGRQPVSVRLLPKSENDRCLNYSRHKSRTSTKSARSALSGRLSKHTMEKPWYVKIVSNVFKWLAGLRPAANHR